MVEQTTDEKNISQVSYFTSRIYKDIPKLNNKKIIQTKYFRDQLKKKRNEQ